MKVRDIIELLKPATTNRGWYGKNTIAYSDHYRPLKELKTVHTVAKQLQTVADCQDKCRQFRSLQEGLFPFYFVFNPVEKEDDLQ